MNSVTSVEGALTQAYLPQRHCWAPRTIQSFMSGRVVSEIQCILAFKLANLILGVTFLKPLQGANPPCFRPNELCTECLNPRTRSLMSGEDRFKPMDVLRGIPQSVALQGKPLIVTS